MQTANDRNFPSSRQICRFANPHLLSLSAIDSLPGEEVHELFCLVGQAICHGREVVDFAEPASVALDEACKVVFGA